MEKLPTKRTFDKCPACGSTNRFFERLTKEAKEDKQGKEDWRLFYQMIDRVVVDNRLAKSLPLGSKVQSYIVFTDICDDCGCVYAMEIRTSIAQKTFVPNLALPGQPRTGHPPFANNPSTS